MMEIFPQQLDLSMRIGQPVCLLMIDMDKFKRLNDTYGHTIGDLALKHVATIMRCNLRSTDLLARYGGEEFVVMMPAASLAKARTSAERLRHCIHNTPLLLDDGASPALALAVSIGVAQCQPGWGLNELLTASDRALYNAKNTGRNRVCEAPNPFAD
jgi:diguanylate cyclase (GGDEF)-like protein